MLLFKNIKNIALKRLFSAVKSRRSLAKVLANPGLCVSKGKLGTYLQDTF